MAGKKRQRGQKRRQLKNELISKNNNTFYATVIVDGVMIQVGDFVSVCIEEESGRNKHGKRKKVETYSYACIESLWADIYGEEWMEVRWFYRPDETPIGKKNMSRFSDDELFESDWLQEISIEALNSKVKILSEGNFKLLPEEERESSDLFFVKYFFSPELNTLTNKNWDFRSKNRGSYSKRLPGGLKNILSNRSTTAPKSKARKNKENLNTLNKDQSFKEASIKLQLSAVPEKLPCRENEREEIYSFLRGSISSGKQGGALYVSGMPGTGKTATVLECISSLQKETYQKKLGPFKFVEINGMKLNHPYEAYTLLWKAVTGEIKPPARAAQLLETRFSNPCPDSHVCIVLVDEIDQMITRKQKVLYNLFDWPTRTYARLVVVAIANTMNLPERLLPRVHSRLGMGRIVFQSYTREQIQTIVEARLEKMPLFDEGAIRLCSMKVSSLSGDIRRALQMCRIAVEICKKQGDGKVKAEHINAASKKLSDNLQLKRMKAGSIHEKILLLAAYKIMTIENLDKFPFDSLFHRFNSLKQNIRPGEGFLDEQRCLAICRRMGRNRLFKLTQNAADRYPFVGPTIESDEIRAALQGDKNFEQILG